MDMPTLITDREFAGLLKLSAKNGWQTIQQWARAGKLKTLTVRVGDKWRFKEDAVREWINRGGMQSR
jgi:excisionase family DNA binding protein